MRTRPDHPPPTAAARCARTLIDAILKEKYLPGTRLPPERELAQTFGCSRSTMRCALAQLEALKLVAPRQGSGYLVGQPFDASPALLEPMVNGRKLPGDMRCALLADLLLVRRRVLLTWLVRIERRVPDEDLGAIRNDLALYAHAARRLDPKKEQDTRIAADMERCVLYDIARLTRGYVLRLHMQPVVETLRNTPDLRAAVYHDPSFNAASWATFVEWMHEGRPGGLAPIVHLFERMDFRALLAFRRAHPGD